MSNETVRVEPPITTPTVGKRKVGDNLHGEVEEGAPAKKRPKKSGNPAAEPNANWPEYFQNVKIIVGFLLLSGLTRRYAALQGAGLLFVPDQFRS